MKDCLFCKIIKGDIPSDLVYEDDDLVVFKDIAPQAPVHLLIVPKDHIESANDINSDNSHLIGKIYERASRLAEELNLVKGYRIVNNCGQDGGQTVSHIHFHLLAGRQLLWPPG